MSDSITGGVFHQWETSIGNFNPVVACGVDPAMLGAMRLQPGDAAPEFTAKVTGVTCEGDGMVSLSEFRGERVVLVFYPKDRTPGCTLQACAMRDAWQELSGKARIFGVSADPHESHRRFIEKHRLPYAVIADEDHAVCSGFGVWVRKSFFFMSYMGVERTTFVIGADGRIEEVFAKVSPIRHLDLLRKSLA